MTITYFDNPLLMSEKATELVLEEITKNPSLLLCAATGSSPLPLYEGLALKAQRKRSLFDKIRILLLDEWLGLPSNEGSCNGYAQEKIIAPLEVAKERYFNFNSEADDIAAECKRMQEVLDKEGPIDLCILGLGKNGHLGFNEPADELQPHCHLANLSLKSQEHDMVAKTSAKPVHGLTLGMQDILSAKKIILLVSGEGKEVVAKQLLSGEITNQCPATWLWKHDNVHCLMVSSGDMH